MRLDDILFKLQHRHVKVVLIVVAVIMAMILLYLPHSEFAIRHDFSKRLDRLLMNVKDIEPHLGEQLQTVTDLQSYDSLMQQIIINCQSLAERQRAVAKMHLSEPLMERLDRTKRLCGDLANVGLYSKQVYESLHDYLDLTTTAIPSSASPEYANWLTKVSSAAQGAKAALNQIDNQRVQDPALGELAAQLEATTGLAQKLKNHENTPGADLPRQLSLDRHNLLAARNYFWHNTVQLDQLQKSIRKIKDQLR